MKRWIHAASNGNDAAYRMMSRRNDFYHMQQDPAYQEIKEMLEHEMDEWQESHSNMPKWSDELSPEEKFRPSRELRTFARKNGYVFKNSSAKGLYWRNIISIERDELP